MKFVLIFGPHAVGKMTVGQELANITGFKLFHNHMSIDFVSNFFSYDTKQGKKLVAYIRQQIFKEIAKSNLNGFIFTFIWFFDLIKDKYYIENVCNIFRKGGWEIYIVELEADLQTRLERNKTENRLKEKHSKRDLKKSQLDLMEGIMNHRLNSKKGEIKEKNYIKIDNTKVSSKEVSEIIKNKFNL